MPDTMKSQAQFVDTVKNMCQSCHAIGTRGIREIPKMFMEQAHDSKTAWAMRTQAGQAMEYMATAINSIGPDRVYETFSKWTDKIAAGALPFDKPSRPKGIERNVVFTLWDWASPTHYQHDAISTDKRNPHVNANGLIYGSPEESTDFIPTLDPVKNIASTIKEPYLDPNMIGLGGRAAWHFGLLGRRDNLGRPHLIHNVMMDEEGKVWFTARTAPAGQSRLLQAGLGASFRQGRSAGNRVRQLSRFDPTTGKWDMINTCFTTHHLYFGHDANNTLWMSAGGPGTGGGMSAGSTPRSSARRTTASPRRAGPRSSSTPTATASAMPMSGQGPRRSDQGQAHRRFVLRHHAEPGRRFHLGPGDGPRILPHRPARLHHSPDAGARSRQHRVG